MASSSKGQGRTRLGKDAMSAFASSARLIELLGNKGLVELDAALDEAGRHWKEGVLDSSNDRFERRPAIELSQLRVEVSKELAAVRIDINTSRLSTIRWVAGLLIAQTGVIIASAFAMMTFLIDALKAN